jgi:hypothetical protein
MKEFDLREEIIFQFGYPIAPTEFPKGWSATEIRLIPQEGITPKL